MKNIAKGDVTKLCQHTRELMFELNAAGETTNDAVLVVRMSPSLQRSQDKTLTI